MLCVARGDVERSGSRPSSETLVKSGGVRVIYYFRSASGRVYLIDIIDKVKQENITKEQAHELKELTDLLS
jgi:hypothetical protein